MWDIRYRPLKFSDVLGQQGAIQLLKARLSRGSALDSSYIFAGGHGQGKTTIARILARAALCQDLNKDDPEPCNACDNCTAILDGAPSAFDEKDAASGGTIDIVRSMVDDLPFSVMNASKRVWLFDEAHRMSIGAQDVLLKPLEEKLVVGIFCTTEAEKIRGPIRSRCEEHTIRKVTRDDVLVRMKMILTAEGVEHEDDAVLTVIDFSGGHVRDVVNKLEMISQLGGLTTANVRDYLNLGVVTAYYDTLLALGDTARAISLVEEACDRVGPDEVAAGLAEAAMNSYRLANGMYADFVYVDRTLAQAVYGRFGTHLLSLAEFFLRMRYPTRLGLICDIVALAQNGGAVAVPTATSAPPVILIAASAPVSAPVQPYVASTPTVAQSQTVVQTPSVAQAAQQAPIAQQPAAVPPAPARTLAPLASNTKIRADGIGALGSGDGLALTDDDHKGVPQGWPRRSSASADVIPFSFQGGLDDENKPLQADEWKREFDRTWGARR
jgi:DNA polymerase III subunit gamma/tau